MKREVDWLEGTANLRKAFVDHPELIPAATSLAKIEQEKGASRPASRTS